MAAVDVEKDCQMRGRDVARIEMVEKVKSRLRIEVL